MLLALHEAYLRALRVLRLPGPGLAKNGEANLRARQRLRRSSENRMHAHAVVARCLNSQNATVMAESFQGCVFPGLRSTSMLAARMAARSMARLSRAPEASRVTRTLDMNAPATRGRLANVACERRRRRDNGGTLAHPPLRFAPVGGSLSVCRFVSRPPAKPFDATVRSAMSRSGGGLVTTFQRLYS